MAFPKTPYLDPHGLDAEARAALRAGTAAPPRGSDKQSASVHRIFAGWHNIDFNAPILSTTLRRRIVGNRPG